MMSDKISWLLSVDPAIAWQVQRDLLDLPESVYLETRSRIPSEGWGKQLLSHQDEDGQWAGGAFIPVDVPWDDWKTTGQPYTATSWAITQLRDFGLNPESDIAKKTVKLIGQNSRWDAGNLTFWEGETEECINGRTIADGIYFGVDMSPLIERLLGQIQPDGGWNCERPESKVSSFATTMNVLEGLAQVPKAAEARKNAEEYLLKRKLFRKLSDGSVVDEEFVKLMYPYRWRYNILRALEYFRQVDNPDDRLSEAIEILRNKDWTLEWELRGKQWFKMGEVGQPNPWITFKALRVLRWWDQHKGKEA